MNLNVLQFTGNVKNDCKALDMLEPTQLRFTRNFKKRSYNVKIRFFFVILYLHGNVKKSHRATVDLAQRMSSLELKFGRKLQV